MSPNDWILIFSVVSHVGTAFPSVGHLITMSGITGPPQRDTTPASVSTFG